MRGKRQQERKQRQDEQKRVEAERRKQERANKQTVAEVAEALGETDVQPLFHIERMVEHLGIDTTLERLQEALAVEQQGGMMLGDGSRRRTPGGVFFYLAKQRLKEEERHADVKTIFARPPKDLLEKQEQTNGEHQPEPSESSESSVPPQTSGTDTNGATAVEKPKKSSARPQQVQQSDRRKR